MHRYLNTVPLFQGLPTQELNELARVCEVRRLRRGECIFTEREPASHVWLIWQGWVSLVKQTPQGRLTTIFTMTPDEALCGISAFEHGTYSATAIAATDTQLIKIPADAFAALLERYPKFTMRVLLSCCDRIRHMADCLSLAQAPVEQRLAYALLRLRATFGKVIPVTHQELARMAGTRWETSIRTLSAMKRRGWMASSRGKITVLAPERLRALLARGQNGVAVRRSATRSARRRVGRNMTLVMERSDTASVH